MARFKVTFTDERSTRSHRSPRTNTIYLEAANADDAREQVRWLHSFFFNRAVKAAADTTIEREVIAALTSPEVDRIRDKAARAILKATVHEMKGVQEAMVKHLAGKKE